MKLHHHIRVPALLLGVIALLLAGLTLPAAAAGTGAVKGVVTIDGKPVGGVTVELYWEADDSEGINGPRIAVDTTNSKGAYSFSGFALDDPKYANYYAGHTLLVKDPRSRIVSVYADFTARSGVTVTRNVKAERASSISGSVTRGDGRATQQLRVEPARNLDDDSEVPPYYRPVTAGADGSFTLPGLPAGDYWLRFTDGSQTYYPQCYDNVPATDNCYGPNDEDSDSTPVHLTSGEHETIHPQVLSTKGHRISGTVTDTSGRPIRTSVDVIASEEAGDDVGEDEIHPTTGAFRIGPLSGNGYRLRAHAAKPWSSVTLPDVVDVSGGDVTGVQIKVKSRATIKAVLTPGTGTVKVAVDVTRAATGSKPSGKTTIRWGTISKTVDLVDGKGTVKLQGLPAGKRQITVSYAGTASTAATTKLFYATVR